jgi:hypothetical protein
MRFALIALLSGLVLLTAGVAAAAPPAASTGPVSAVGPTSATASGTVNPHGISTSWYVEYGTTTAYGKKTTTRSAGSGTADSQVSATLTGLAPGTTYHYRLVATNTDGTTRGADGIFATSSAPVAVTGSASAVTTTSATLAGTVDPNGRATTWYFEYGTSTGYGSRSPSRSAGSGTAATGVSSPVVSLTPGRLYHYRLVATSDAGTSRGADRTFSTAGAPIAATGSVSGVTTRGATLRGSVNASGQATTWYFDYGPTTAYGLRTPVRNAGSGTKAASVSVGVSGLRTAASYHYRLVAVNASGTSIGADRAFRTAGPPLARTGPALEIGTSTATVTGVVNPQGRGTTWYFEYGTTARYGSRTTSRNAGSGFGDVAVSVPLSGLQSAAAYHVRIVARNASGTTRSTDLLFRTTGVTLAARAGRVVFGRPLLLSGRVPSARAGEPVTILARPLGRPASAIATVLTADGGVWRHTVRPRLRTSYTASWNGLLSRARTIGVRPAVSFRRVGVARFTTRVVAARSFARRVVQLQRRTRFGNWVTVKRVRLNRRSAKVFTARIGPRTARLRIVISDVQTGRGYLAGISRTIVYRRR